MQERKGQAALEFLTTYGWAFLVILIMISALAYFGVLSPTNFIPDRCVVPPGFSCEEYQISQGTGGTVDIQIFLRNQQGESINLGNATVLDGEFTDPATCETVNTNNPSNPYLVGSQAEFLINCTGTNSIPGDYPAVGEKILTQMNFNYSSVGGQFTQRGNLELFAPIQ